MNYEEINKEVNKYLLNVPINTGIISTESKEQKLFSSDFLEKLKSFDTTPADLKGLSTIKTVENGFFSKKNEKIQDENFIDYEKPTHFTVYTDLYIYIQYI